eukprot:6129835-Prymnesium_polylepis.1
MATGQRRRALLLGVLAHCTGSSAQTSIGSGSISPPPPALAPGMAISWMLKQGFGEALDRRPNQKIAQLCTPKR